MNRLLTAICLTLLLFVSTGAQTNSTPSVPAAVKAGATQQPAVDVTKAADASRLNTEVVNLFKQKKYDEALPLAQRSLEISENELKADPKFSVTSLFNLATIYFEKGKHGEAEQLYKRLLILQQPESSFGLPVSDTLTRLALLRFWKRDTAAAASLMRRSIAIKEKVQGQNHTDVAQSSFILAEFYSLNGNVKEAEPLYQRALQIWIKQSGKEDHRVENALDRYYCMLANNGQTKRYEEFRKTVLLSEADNAHTSTDVLNGKATSKPVPPYPRKALEGRIYGVTAVKIVVDETGKVVKAKAICGHHLLTGASEEAVLKAQFTPTLLDGQPVKVNGVMTYNFVLR